MGRDFNKFGEGLIGRFSIVKPVVGALQRFAINGGAALAIACDLLIVGRESFIQVGEAQIGMAAPYNLAWLSLRHPESTIARVALIGDRIYGEESEIFWAYSFLLRRFSES